jgi:phage terminase large subunit GpA-like protein
MDAGAVVAWPQRYNKDELSAIQHAMNLKLRDEAAFFAEYQNEPIQEKEGEGQLTADEIVQKLNGHPRGLVPLNCTALTLFIDVQQKALFWMLCGWEPDFTGFVVDYGTWPDQKRLYFTLRDIRRTLAQQKPGAGLEGAVYHGLERLCEEKLTVRYRREDGLEMKIGRCLIDANWGQSTDVVYQFCRQSTFSGIVLPSHGKYIGASSIPFSDYKRKKGDRVGLHWRIPNVIGKRAMRHILIDTNYWKSFVQARLSVAMGDPGCLSLFGRDAATHRLLADHLTAEYCVRTAAQGRTVDEWKLKAIRPDNHWLDCLVGCGVAASMEGVKLFGTESNREKPATRIRLSQVQKGRQVCRT